MSYFKPKSLTFWAGASSTALGALLGYHEVSNLGVLGDAAQVWAGPIGPHTMISSGLGLIGIRKAVGA